MSKAKHIINIALAGAAVAMGIVVIVLSTLNADIVIVIGDYIKMLAFAVLAFGLLALHNMPKSPQ